MRFPDEYGIAYVNAMPKMDLAGGVLTVVVTSGQNQQMFAMPVWLARLANAKVSELLAQQDSISTAA